MKQKLLVIVLTLVMLSLATIMAGYFWVQAQLKPVSASTESQKFVVAKGQALVTTAQQLRDQGLIRHPQVFRYYAQFNKLDTKIQAGSYELSPSMNTQEIAAQLTEGTEDIWITLPEGWRREEVAEYLSKQELPQFDEQRFLQLSAATEGKLFPDTYLIPKESTAEYIHSLLTNTYNSKVTVGLADSFKKTRLSPDQALVLASIVEREGRGYENMRHVAGVLLNRLDIGMALQADATLQYISGKDKNGKWWSPPSIQVKQSTPPYNTYAYPGLPPAPIANPGIDAIQAVLDPLDTEHLFYIHAPSGESYFARTLDEHNANINKYLR